MNLLKLYLVCFLSIPFLSYFLGYTDYFLQSKEYLPILLNSVFSLILILKLKKDLTIPAFKWFAGILLLFLFSSFKNGFANQIFIDKSILLYILVLGLFTHHFIKEKTSKDNITVFAYIFICFSFLQIFLSFIIFHFGLESTNGLAFKGNFISVFYNPSIYINWMLLLSPFAFTFTYLINSRISHYRIIGWFCYFIIIILFITMFINKNRTGLIVILSLIVYYLIDKFTLNYKNKFFILGISCFFLIISLLKINKEDSNSGRLLILKVTTNMIYDNPLFGVGFNNYRSEYNNYQKVYLKSFSSQKELLLANDNNYANNEWLQFIAEIGIVGFLIFLFLLSKVYTILFQNNNNDISQDNLWLHKSKNGFLIVLFILSIFSNPFRIPEIVNLISVLFIFFIVMISFDRKIEFMEPTFSKKILIVLLFILSTPIIIQQYYLIQWMKYSEKFFKGNKEIFNFQNKYLDKNESYLYTTARQLFYQENYLGSINQLKKIKGIKNDSQSEILFGQNYSKLEKHDKAIKYFQSANLMNPKLFRPKYLIMNEYLLKRDTISAVKQAKIIINSPIKIPSRETDYYISKARMVTFLPKQTRLAKPK